MMTQEEYMNVTALRAAGWTITQIAEHVGYHPATVSGWLRDGGPPAKRETPVDDLVVGRRRNRDRPAVVMRDPETHTTDSALPRRDLRPTAGSAVSSARVVALAHQGRTKRP